LLRQTLLLLIFLFKDKELNKTWVYKSSHTACDMVMNDKVCSLENYGLLEYKIL